MNWPSPLCLLHSHTPSPSPPKGPPSLLQPQESLSFFPHALSPRSSPLSHKCALRLNSTSPLNPRLRRYTPTTPSIYDSPRYFLLGAPSSASKCRTSREFTTGGRVILAADPSFIHALLYNIRFGSNIGFLGDRTVSRSCPNVALAVDHPNIVDVDIQMQFLQECTRGPFTSTPLPNFRVCTGSQSNIPFKSSPKVLSIMPPASQFTPRLPVSIPL
ncbi:hypothetical protein M422DRAFT_247588 [Sphaerobolus stellatus SS14]|nr:hypothetical protein M422DRAFT_247588 [Sphaerobolus stellatus SS14]